MLLILRFSCCVYCTSTLENHSAMNDTFMGIICCIMIFLLNAAIMYTIQTKRDYKYNILFIASTGYLSKLNESYLIKIPTYNSQYVFQQLISIFIHTPYLIQIDGLVLEISFVGFECLTVSCKMQILQFYIHPKFQLLLPPTFQARRNHIFSKSRIKTINWLVNVTAVQMKYMLRGVSDKTMMEIAFLLF